MSTTVNEPPGRAKVAAAPRANAVLTLAIDVGGSRLKAGVLSETGAMVQGPARVDTPHPATPASVLALLENLISPLGRFDRISIGFPGMVRRGRVLTAPNLSDEAWHGYPLAAELARRTGRPARLLNDATVQGLGVINGRGLECVITLGTGMGFALFREGMLTPQLEIGQHLARNDMTYDEYVGNAAMADVGRTQVEQARQTRDRGARRAGRVRRDAHRRRQRQARRVRVAETLPDRSPTKPGSPAACGYGTRCSTPCRTLPQSRWSGPRL